MSGTTEPRIIGSYQLEERVGKGGMGEVYRARHTRLDTERAVKLLPPSLAAEPDFLKRFEHEAASAARLEHPNILPVYEYGEAAGAPYLVMPYVRGGTLKERLARGPLTVAELLSLLGQAAEALDYAHEQGIVHRDVKPANLLLDGRGRLYLADFGIAKALEGAEGLTRTGVGVGTPEYMAPEQAQGRADARSDLYALGVILYQMLTGRVPYTGNSTVEVLMKHLQDPLPLLPLRSVAPAVPPRVEAVVSKALAKNPNDRYASGAAMVEDLREAFACTPAGAEAATVIGAGPAYPPGPATAPGGGTPPPYGAGPGATVVGGAAAYTAAVGSGTPPPYSGAPHGGTPPPVGTTPPPYGGAPGGFGVQGGGTPPPQGGYTPPPQGGYAPPPNNYGGAMPPPPPPNNYGGPPGGNQPPRGANRGLLFGLLGGLAVALIVCLGVVAVLASRFAGGSPTPTVQAAAPPTTTTIAAVNVGATQTAVASARPSGAPTAAPSSSPSPSPAASVAPSAAPTVVASSAPAASPSPSPSAAPSAAPTVAPTATTVAFFPSTSPSAAPTATVRPTVAPTVAPTPRPSTAPAGQLPTGNAPAGWKSYRGNAKVPFAMYYPPDWTVDESRASEGRIYFYAPGVTQPYDDAVWVLIATNGTPDPTANVDVQRDQYFNNEIKASHPEAGINITRNNQFSGITFASLGTNFNSGSDLCFAYIGLGLNKNVPWRFRLNSLDTDYDANLSTYFSDMIGSLNIYGNP